ncbi:cytochrome P450 [Infundibulicybe gibba]|nr:cytochrome P450 [Infundibulicybe gibba]
MVFSLVDAFGITLVLTTSYILYHAIIAPAFNPLRRISGPPVRRFFGNHLQFVLDPSMSPRVHDLYVKKYGRSIRIRGVGPWDERLLTLDPVSVNHVLKHSTIYEKPWQSRRLITSLIGCGMLAAEGQVHKRQRRVATPAFSIQNMRALVPLVFDKGSELKSKWMNIISQNQEEHQSPPHVPVRLDVCHWISRATFDVIGLAGFDYDFRAIQDESNELFAAYKEMFEVAISQGRLVRTVIGIYMPYLNALFPDRVMRTIQRCQGVIHRVAGHLIQEKKRKIAEGEASGCAYVGKDLLSLLLKSNNATDLPPEHRISDEDILNNINTFMFAGSDTSSLTITWALLLLAQHPWTQSRLREELLTILPAAPLASLTEDEIQSLHTEVTNLPFLDNVARETLRLIPPVHSSIRVATQNDEIPTSYPVRDANGNIMEGKQTVAISKGSFVHVAVEAFNLDKGIWGEDAWEFNPDRWDNLPEGVADLPGLFSNTLTFSAGPRSCIGMRFSMIEIKTFLYILITNFTFAQTDDTIIKANV